MDIATTRQKIAGQKIIEQAAPALVTGLLLWLLLALTAFLYWPGLSGPFLLDDLVHLPELGRQGGIDDWQSALRFVLKDAFNPIGRPLALLSFLLNDLNWPSEPDAFKYTNVGLHLLNGGLVFLFCIKLTPAPEATQTRALLIALSAAAIWLLHPYHVSTVLYVIQRMTLLASSCMLAGLVAYIHGRRLLDQDRPSGWLWMSLGIGLGTGLGLLAKEIAILLPLLTLVVEFTILRGQGLQQSGAWRLWASVFLVLPLAGLLAWLVFFVDLPQSYSGREFSMTERVLSQPRILFVYIGYLLVPRRQGTGLFHDDFPLSQGLLDPVSTLLALAGVGVLLVVGILARKRQPVLAFAILWFFAAHLLESSVLALEPLFEHRNYLPSIGLFFGLSYYALRVSGRIGRIISIGMIVYISLTGLALWQNTKLWGNWLELLETWAAEHPDSRRAQQAVSDVWVRTGQLEKVTIKSEKLVRDHPTDPSARMQLLLLACIKQQPISAESLNELLKTLQSGRYSTSVLPTLKILVTKRSLTGAHPVVCPNTVTAGALGEMLRRLIKNPDFQRRRLASSNLYFLQATHFAGTGRVDDALDSLNNNYRVRPSLEALISAADLLSRIGRHQQATMKMEQARRYLENRPLTTLGKKQLVRDWRKTLAQRQARHLSQSKPGRPARRGNNARQAAP